MTFAENAFQPDILEVISNLSNDAVFTPPKIANAVLDLLPEEVWSDPTLRWLDPGCKTGVFPREIIKRLLQGLKDSIPDEGARLEHILTNMVFAIATEDIYALMTRRTIYHSIDASSDLSAIRMKTPEGNVWHSKVNHTFEKGRCQECRGGKADLEVKGRDNKAYGFIHSHGRELLEKDWNMKFDVIVGNPPYQMAGGGGGSNDTPLYDAFVEQAIALGPRYISFVIPSRWMAGGRDLDKFRENMLGDERLRKIVDYPNAEEVFPGIGKSIKGGVCYFLWDSEGKGDCEVTLVREGQPSKPTKRKLNEFDVLVRDGRALDILHKVLAFNEPKMDALVSGDTPFGLATNFQGYRKGAQKPQDIKVFLKSASGREEKWIDPTLIHKNVHAIPKWKVFIPEAGSDGGQKIPDVVLGKPFVGGPRTVSTQTFLYAGPLDTKAEAESLHAYIQTRFARFLVSLRKISQHAMKSVYSWVPQQTWDHLWTDEELFKKYGISEEERAYIELMIKEM